VGGKRRQSAIGLSLIASLFAIEVQGRGAERSTPCAAVRMSRSVWDATRARSLTARSPTPAEALASDLVRCRVVVGMTKRRVRRLLGPPDARTAGSSRSHEVDWQYQLDLDRGIFSELSYLRLVFGPRGSVRRAEFLPPD
jgi:hypothetical protein